MSVNGVNSATANNTASNAVIDSVVTQGKNMLVGGAIGLATGKVVSLAAPVSRAKIADELVDHFAKTRPDVTKTLSEADGVITRGAAYKSAQDLLKVLSNAKDYQLSSILSKVKRLFVKLGEKIPEGEFTKDSAIACVTNYINNHKVTDEQVNAAKDVIENTSKTLRDEALKKIEIFFSTARKDRSADDVVALAKKAAKKTQSVHIMGTLAGVGILAMMFSELFDNILPKKNKNKTANAQTQTSNSALQTHQG